MFKEGQGSAYDDALLGNRNRGQRISAHGYTLEWYRMYQIVVSYVPDRKKVILIFLSTIDTIIANH